MKSDSVYHTIYVSVRTIPYGKVMSYGEVAKAAGLFRGARMVGWALASLPPDSTIPWHRVVNRHGEISIVNPQAPPTLQQALLEAEGVEVKEVDGRLLLPNPPWHQSS